MDKAPNDHSSGSNSNEDDKSFDTTKMETVFPKEPKTNKEEEESTLNRPQARFKVGEQVLVVFGIILYKAKILKVNYLEDMDVYIYKVHYLGWSKKNDELVAELRVLKFTDDMVQRHDDIRTAFDCVPMRPKNGAKRRSTKRQSLAKGNTDEASSAHSKDSSASGTGTSSDEKIKIKNETIWARTVETEKLFHAKQEIRIELPDKLKQILYDDWVAVNYKHKLTQVPSNHTVDSILEIFINTKYNQSLETKFHPSPEELNSLIEGIRYYFNSILSNQLLYPSEQAQHDEVLGEYCPRMPSAFYGPVHLLRLFTKLGEHLALTTMEPYETDSMLKGIQLILKFLDDNDWYFEDSDFEEEEFEPFVECEVLIDVREDENVFEQDPSVDTMNCAELGEDSVDHQDVKKSELLTNPDVEDKTSEVEEKIQIYEPVFNLDPSMEPMKTNLESLAHDTPHIDPQHSQVVDPNLENTEKHQEDPVPVNAEPEDQSHEGSLNDDDSNIKLCDASMEVNNTEAIVDHDDDVEEEEFVDAEDGSRVISSEPE